MDRLSEYVVKHSTCGMPRCEYVENGIEIDCDRCQEIMIAEHDEQVRADAIDEYMESLCKKLEECQTGFNMVSMANIWHYSREVAEQLKEQKNLTCFDCEHHFMSDCYLECNKHNRINDNKICDDFEQLKE